MSQSELYQAVILDHNRSPRNFGRLPEPCRHAEGYNPLCGDKVSVFVRVADGQVVDARFEGDGCAISRASASLMTQAVIGRSESEARALAEAFVAMVTGQTVHDRDLLGKLVALEGVAAYPMRVKCASLSWHAMTAALDGRDQPVSTEAAR